MNKPLVTLATLLLCAAGAAQAQVAQADIDLWTKNYDGQELSQSVAKCTAPVIPEVSTNNKDIKAVMDDFNRWNDCYEGAVEKLGLDREPVSHVPAPVRFGMTVDQYKEAQVHMDKVYAKAIEDIGKQASPVIASYTNWRAKTEDYVTKTENDRKVSAQLQEMLADQRKKAGVSTWGRGASGTVSR
ncbi:hypothetical protein E4L96_00750 [Massilia arenosa]|uniref:Uncharacterized protein n=1 Tax=Zemynaea arenosa TaxID=2561931 RepID=A0A4Y9STL2_9BURK|nr:hypothetical protein [Massilia arenosa]TFW30020.1 hypothetical protein E4L96_00750 [Massilia arenosa]